MTTTTTNTTANTAKTAKLYLVREFDSRVGGKSYAAWTEGVVYAMQVDYKTMYTGTQLRMCEHYELVRNPESYAIDRKFWKEVSFKELPAMCIPQVLNTFGPDVIPWAETRWASYEAYMEWCEPTTLEGKLQKALREPREFPKKEVAEVSQTYNLGKEGYKLSWTERTLYQTPWGWYLYGTSYYYTEGFRYELEQLADEEAKSLIVLKKKHDQEEARQKKQYGRHCAVLARKYGLPWDVVSAFKGEEESIKRFLRTLKDAIETHKEFDSWELECGRERRRSELKRLGIDIAYVDPNRIAPYVCECLEEGGIQE